MMNNLMINSLKILLKIIRFNIRILKYNPLEIQ